MGLNKSDIYITIPLYNDSKMILNVIKSLNDNEYKLVKNNINAIIEFRIVL